MPDWNALTNEQKDHIIFAAEMWSCQCTGDHRQMALDMFNAVMQAPDLLSSLPEIVRLREALAERDVIDKAEEEETLSGYSALFHKLIEQGKSYGYAHGYVTARLLNDERAKHIRELVRLREEVERLREALTLAKQEIDWWVDEHSCCKGHEAGVVTAIDAALSSDGGELVQQRGASDSPQCDHPVAEQVHEGEMKIPGAQHYEHIRGEFIYGVGMVYTRVDGSHAEECRCRWCAEAFLNASATTSGDRTASTPESPGLNHTSSDGGEG